MLEAVDTRRLLRCIAGIVSSLFPLALANRVSSHFAKSRHQTTSSISCSKNLQGPMADASHSHRPYYTTRTDEPTRQSVRRTTVAVLEPNTLTFRARTTHLTQSPPLNIIAYVLVDSLAFTFTHTPAFFVYWCILHQFEYTQRPLALTMSDTHAHQRTR